LHDHRAEGSNRRAAAVLEAKGGGGLSVRNDQEFIAEARRQILDKKLEEAAVNGSGAEWPTEPESIAAGWKARLLLSDKGAPKALLANAITALRHAPEWAGVLAYNEFSLGTVALKPAPWQSGSHTQAEWTDHEDRLTANWLQHHGILVGVEVAGQAAQTVARDHPFHPVREYLDTLTWDQTKRIDTWLSLYLGVEHTHYVAAVGERWLISAVARIYRPGAKADCCLILEGAQGILKSTALKTIADPWFTDEIADLGSKDSAMQTRGVWLIEIAELDSMRGAEVGKIKAFMSRVADRFRPPYGKRLIDSPRQCVFAGSVNHNSYLRDETGGRRFWPVSCGQIDIRALARDRDQLWAEARERFQGGAVWWLDSKELNQQAAAEQADRHEGDPWEEIIAPWLALRTDVSVGEVLTQCVKKSPDQWTQVDKNRVARSLRALMWRRYNARVEGGREWRYGKL
jgi:predicted P-loop ATPase